LIDLVRTLRYIPCYSMMTVGLGWFRLLLIGVINVWISHVK